MILSLLLTACETDPLGLAGPQQGGIRVCEEGACGGDSVAISVRGTVSAIDDPIGDCTRSVTVDDGAGGTFAVGLTVTDDDGTDITPDPGVAVGDTLMVNYRYEMPFGDVAGFTLADNEGLFFAAEEGGWGNALDDADVPGLTVESGDTVATEETDCQPKEFHEIVFNGDEDVTLTTVDSGQIVLGGRTLTALAIQDWRFVEDSPGLDGLVCEQSENTPFRSWVVSL